MNFEWLDGLPTVVPGLLHAFGWVLLAVWVWTRPKESILSGAADRKAWRDLRLWVIPLAIIQVTLYLVL
ncbi:MAG: hypothetical protein RL885_27950 [Planctomycetota bacterium]